MARKKPWIEIESLVMELQRLLPRVGEDDQGIEIDIDHAIDEVAPLFGDEVSRATKVDGVLVWELQWFGEGHSVSSVDRGFFRLLGECAEETTFISRIVEESSIRYEVLLGSVQGNGHVHHVRFVVRGTKLASICSDYREIGRSFGR